MEFKEQYDASVAKCEEYLHRIMDSVKDDFKIKEAMEYSLFAGGKRVRPVLAMGVCEMLGGNPERVMPFACAIELIHTYSLIHDDLPCMDDDDLRRGMPTSHKKFGEDMAVLTGDALQSLAFEIMAQSDENPQIILECIRTVAVAAGISGMVGGQELDIASKRETAEELERINLLKTGALIAASCWMGAIIAGCDVSQMQNVGIFAKNLGLAFQVKDDILDMTGTREELGKTVGTDDRKGIQTYASLLGLEGAERLLEEYIEEAKFAIHEFGEKSYFLQDLANYIRERKS
ncbi:MAG: polyprenyl synthetase family protein [Oscillospiraceae bacterium]|nr:polyprenyl synthetase family protein [Oscillospiraceae bacterium]